VIPTLTHHSDIVSDISSGSIQHYILVVYPPFYLAYVLTFYVAVFGILSHIYSDILSGIYSDIISGILTGIYA
jgi:hypothetical protein